MISSFAAGRNRDESSFRPRADYVSPTDQVSLPLSLTLFAWRKPPRQARETRRIGLHMARLP